MTSSPAPFSVNNLSLLVSEALSVKGIETPSLLEDCIASLRKIASNESQGIVAEVADNLQHIYITSVDHSDLRQFSGFLSLLHALLPSLPPSSIISSWWDLALRPALRTPKLNQLSVSQAKELVLHGMSGGEESKASEFRRRIVDLYLLDVLSDSSGDDAVETAKMEAEEQELRRCWKMHLEGILLSDGIRRPKVRSAMNYQNK
jgi:hypothetical protein